MTFLHATVQAVAKLDYDQKYASPRSLVTALGPSSRNVVLLTHESSLKVDISLITLPPYQLMLPWFSDAITSILAAGGTNDVISVLSLLANPFIKEFPPVMAIFV